jgi:ABC-type uncharacterized transport system ATPase subunit
MHVSIRHLSKSFGALKANDDISVDFAAGQIHGVLGENGAGKSTLMKLLAGVYAADAGTVTIDARPVTLGTPRQSIVAGIGMVGQDPLDIPVFSVIDNIACGIGMPARSELFLEYQRLASDLGFTVSASQRIGDLTVGQRQQVEIVRLLLAGSQVLILDEPTTGITADQIAALFTALRRLADAGKTVLFVTHKLDEVVALCDTITVLRGGCIVGAQRAMPVSKTDMLHAMFGESNPPERVAVALDEDAPVRWHCKGVTLRDQHFAIGPIHHRIHQGRIVALAGLEGSGQRAYLQHLAGLLLPVEGRTTFEGDALQRHHRDVAFLPADRLREGIVGEMSLYDHVCLMRADLVGSGESPLDKTKQLIAEYDIKAEWDTPLALLSGGNQQRAMLALIPDAVKGILLEHPTRGLDARSAAAVWSRLQQRRAQGTSVVFFAADLDEILLYADEIVVFFAGRVSRLIARDAVTEAQLAAFIGGVGFAEVQS